MIVLEVEKRRIFAELTQLIIIYLWGGRGWGGCFLPNIYGTLKHGQSFVDHGYYRGEDW